MNDARDDGPTVRRLRGLLLSVLTLGMLGTAADLILIAHYEDGWQVAPLILIGVALVAVAGVAIRTSWVGLTIVRVVMALFIASGALGVMFHYNGNSEFQRELDPALRGWPLAVRVLTAKSPPALAPGVMVQLGLLGLLYTYRHPALNHEPYQPRRAR